MKDSTTAPNRFSVVSLTAEEVGRSPAIVDAVLDLLVAEWPKLSRAARKNSILRTCEGTVGGGVAGARARHFAFLSDGVVIGHARLARAVGTRPRLYGGCDVVLESFVIAKEERGKNRARRFFDMLVEDPAVLASVVAGGPSVPGRVGAAPARPAEYMELSCRAELVGFYEKLGFFVVADAGSSSGVVDEGGAESARESRNPLEAMLSKMAEEQRRRARNDHPGSDNNDVDDASLEHESSEDQDRVVMMRRRLVFDGPTFSSLGGRGGLVPRLQIGPSCGFVAAAMAIQYLLQRGATSSRAEGVEVDDVDHIASQDSGAPQILVISSSEAEIISGEVRSSAPPLPDTTPCDDLVGQLLRAGRKAGVTVDGEMFDAGALARVTNEVLLLRANVTTKSDAESVRNFFADSAKDFRCEKVDFLSSTSSTICRALEDGEGGSSDGSSSSLAGNNYVHDDPAAQMEDEGFELFCQRLSDSVVAKKLPVLVPYEQDAGSHAPVVVPAPTNCCDEGRTKKAKQHPHWCAVVGVTSNLVGVSFRHGSSLQPVSCGIRQLWDSCVSLRHSGRSGLAGQAVFFLDCRGRGIS